jgi:hypothetical protein
LASQRSINARSGAAGRSTLPREFDTHPLYKHLCDLTRGRLVRVLPLTSVERRGWIHRVHVAAGDGWSITDQIRTVSAQRFRRHAPEIIVFPDEFGEVRNILAQIARGAGLDDPLAVRVHSAVDGVRSSRC